MKTTMMACGLALLLIAGSLTTGFVNEAEALDNGVAFGAYAAPVDGLTNTTAIEKLERQLGTTLPMVRTFSKWDDAIGEDKKFHRWIRDGDRQLMASVKPQRGNGQEVRWRDIANAQPGSKIHNEMVALASGVKRFGEPVILGFHHEPEHKKNLSFGTSSDYKAAFRKLHDVFEQQGVRNVEFAWIMTSWAFEVGDIRPDDRRIAEKWYPGDDVVDYISVQEYNWATCRDNNDSWDTLEEGLEPFMRFARKHPSKDLILAEFGTPEGNNGQKAEWLDETRALFKRGEYKDRFAAILYFHYDDSPNGNNRCNWWLDSSTSSLNAAKRLANDSFYQAEIGAGGGGGNNGGDGGGAEPAPPAVPTPVGGCTAVRTGDTVTLSWSDDGRTPAVRRNGSWLTTLANGTTSYVDRNAPAGATYMIRGGGVTSRTCTEGGAAPDCAVSRDGNTVRLTWDDEGGRHVIRRNGSWLATLGKGVDTFVDRNAPNGATYELRTHTGQGRIDTPCG